MKNPTITGLERFYPGLEVPANQIQAFLKSDDLLFILSIRGCIIKRFFPEDAPGFLNWLIENDIRNVK